MTHPGKPAKPSRKLMWYDRELAANVQEAMHALTDLLTHRETIEEVVNGTGTYHGDYNLEEGEAFAKKWNIPFSRKLYETTISSLNDKAAIDDLYWRGSSYNC